MRYLHSTIKFVIRDSHFDLYYLYSSTNGYRPNRSAKDAILKVKEYAEQGYTFVVVLDLSKYFDTLNHEILINLLRKNVKDERVVQLIKRYLKSGVMENRVAIDTEEGSPQGGNLSPFSAIDGHSSFLGHTQDSY